MRHPEFLLRQGSEGEGIVKPVGAGTLPKRCHTIPTRVKRERGGDEAQMPHLPLSLRSTIIFTPRLGRNVSVAFGSGTTFCPATNSKVTR
jgi:hypothetical protein